MIAGGFVVAIASKKLIAFDNVGVKAYARQISKLCYNIG
jgi:hypothetical protein